MSEESLQKLKEIAREVMTYRREGCDDVGERPFYWAEARAMILEVATRFAAEMVARERELVCSKCGTPVAITSCPAALHDERSNSELAGHTPVTRAEFERLHQEEEP